MLYRSQVKRLPCAGLRKRNHALWHLKLFSGRLPGSPVFLINLTYLRIPNEAKEWTLMSSQKHQVQVMKFYIITRDAALSQKELCKGTQLGMRNSVFGVPQLLRIPICHIDIDSFNYSSSKSVKDIEKVCIKCAAAFKALGPVWVLPCSWPRSISRSSFAKLVSCAAT